jgi:hypothetical protein
MPDPNAPFANLVPGFDFLQSLVRNASSALPGVGQWIAPTMDPAEIEKRISELKTVQFWLEQNSRMITGTIQALEVQRMTLSTLKSMNVSMGDLRDALSIKPIVAAASSPAAPNWAAAPAAAGDEAAAAPLVDPMKWWGALTQQFAQIATEAIEKNSGAAETAKNLADAMVQQGLDAGTAMREAASALPAAAQEAATAMANQVAESASLASATAKAAVKSASKAATARSAAASPAAPRKRAPAKKSG